MEQNSGVTSTDAVAVNVLNKASGSNATPKILSLPERLAAYERMSKSWKAEFPMTHAEVFKRRIVPPNGYMNPKLLNAHTLYCLTLNSMIERVPALLNDGVTAANMYTAYRMIDFDMPTFFISGELLKMLELTDPPEDMLLSDLKWPMDVMAFVLPTDYCQKYFLGALMPFVTICKRYVGTLNGCLTKRLDIGKSYPCVSRVGGIFVCGSDFKSGSDYAASHKESSTVKSLSIAEFTDYSEELGKAGFEVPDKDPERDPKIPKLMTKLALKVMMAMVAKPELVEMGECVRPMKAKGGRTKDALWSPNYIGRWWRTEAPPHEAGHHASPIVHWRRGHFRGQHHGPKNSLVKTIWVEPVWVNAEAYIDNNEKKG